MKTLKINKRRFVEWFWSDEDSLVDLGNDVVEALIDEGTYTKTLSDAWEQCGYIHRSLVLNPEVAEWNKDNEIIDPSSEYDVEWVEQ